MGQSGWCSINMSEDDDLKMIRRLVDDDDDDDDDDGDDKHQSGVGWMRRPRFWREQH